MSAPLDRRVESGTRDMLDLHRSRLDAGAGRLGWKAAFGSPSGRQALDLDRPLVGFLTRDRQLRAGGTASIEGWTTPLLEAEVAVHIGRDVPTHPSSSDVEHAVAGLSAAIELADLHAPPTDVVEILRGNIFHRHVVLGETVVPLRDLDDVGAVVSRDGVEVVRTEDPQAQTGHVLDVVASIADTLDRLGERLLAGDVVITGAVVPPLPVAPGQLFEVHLTGIGRVAVSLEGPRA